MSKEFLPPQPSGAPQSVEQAQEAQPSQEKPEMPQQLDQDAMESAVEGEVIMEYGSAQCVRVPIAALEFGGKRPSLYDIAEEYSSIMDEITARHGEMDEELIARFSAIRGTYAEKMENCGKFLRTLQDREQAAKDEMARRTDEVSRLRTRKKSAEVEVKSWKQYIINQMDAVDKPKFKGQILNMTAYDSKLGCNVYEADRVPDAFQSVTVTMPADKWAIVETALRATLQAVCDSESPYAVMKEPDTVAIIAQFEACQGEEQVPGSVVSKGRSLRIT